MALLVKLGPFHQTSWWPTVRAACPHCAISHCSASRRDQLASAFVGLGADGSGHTGRSAMPQAELPDHVGILGPAGGIVAADRFKLVAVAEKERRLRPDRAQFLKANR